MGTLVGTGHLWGQRRGHGTYRDDTQVRHRVSRRLYTCLPSAFKNGGGQRAEFGVCVSPPVSPPPQGALPIPSVSPRKPLSSRRIHITSGLVTTTCRKQMEAGKLMRKMC